MYITDEILQNDRLVSHIAIPRMIEVEQSFDQEKITDIAKALLWELEDKGMGQTITPGMQIAITAGSRGIANISSIIRVLVDYVYHHGGEPFIVPAMGSHGGAVAHGQRSLLAGCGITEEEMGAPIYATMDVAQIGLLDNGVPVYMDRYAAEADGVILVNRIKPHTSFRGRYESGLFKMAAIGLGKQKGAEACHSKGFSAMAEMVEGLGKHIVSSGHILFGLGILENAFDETKAFHALLPAEIIVQEPVLLAEAKGLMPQILIPQCDVLVIDYIGKNFSGPGADPNITGAFATDYASGGLDAQSVVVLDLSEESHGNANGIGVADVTTRQLFEKFDMAATYPNALTSTLAVNAKIPLVMSSHKRAIQAGIKFATGAQADQVRIIRIENSLHIKRIWISEALLAEAQAIPGIRICTEALAWPFDQNGNLF